NQSGLKWTNRAAAVEVDQRVERAWRSCLIGIIDDHRPEPVGRQGVLTERVRERSRGKQHLGGVRARSSQLERAVVEIERVLLATRLQLGLSGALERFDAGQTRAATVGGQRRARRIELALPVAELRCALRALKRGVRSDGRPAG